MTSRSEAAELLRDGAQSPVTAVSYQALGTTVTVVVHGGEAAAAAALDAVRGEVAAIDAACSRFREDSELSRVNALAGRAVPVGPLLLQAVTVALRAARITDGLVDPTLGRQLRLLGYDRDFSSLPTSMLAGPSRAPSGSARAFRAFGAGGGSSGGASSGGASSAWVPEAAGTLEADASEAPGTLEAEAPEAAGAVLTLVARTAPAWTRVLVDPGRGTITVPEGVELDLGATAKALAVDRATAGAARAAAGVTSAAGAAGTTAGNGNGAPGVLVSIGGDLAVAGTPPTGGWTIRVADDHKAGGDEPGETIAITGGAVATSGTAVRRWYRGTTPVHHLVDPATGQPAAPVWRTVSVAAATCVDANTASTAAMILGRQAPEWLAAQGLPGRLVTPEGAIVTVSGWPESP
ncbi:MAG TPA: FAD:protein FMN transferase [Acidimicrobiales bacterium]|nr:FAD:protein FMN transferase [Acidimicrobiales bacterium]